MAKKNGKNAPGVGSIVRATVNREVVTSDTFASLYTNDTQLLVTPWDVRLTFGVVDDVATGGEKRAIKIKQVGEVRMSPQHAKRIAIILMKQLQNYEAGIGPIPQPKDD